jgi:hypothetical protein
MLQRLQNAGCQRGVFTKNAAAMVARLAGGYAGKINHLCELSLLTAYNLGETKIRPELVAAAAQNLRLPEDHYQLRVYDDIWSNGAVTAAPEPEFDILAAI